MKRPDFLDLSFEVAMTKIGMIKDGEANREWFEESLRNSKRAVEFGRAQIEKELERVLTGEA